MSYHRSPSIREDREYIGEVYDELSESYFTVTVAYNYHEWSEGHPYGDTTAYERLSETSIESYELEGDNISREELVHKFGEEQVKQLEENLE
jgi:hypothetical protein